MFREQHLCGQTHVRTHRWLVFQVSLFLILVITQTWFTQTWFTQIGFAQTLVDSDPPTQPPIQVQSDTTVSGFAGGITSNDFVPLMDLIQSVIKSDSWQDNGGEGSLIDYPAGVLVDPTVATASATADLPPIPPSQAASAAVADVNKNSELRVISLNRIEDTVLEAHNRNRPLTDEVKHLAGIYRIDYVFIDTENNDILIAGPAGSWRTNTAGDIVNVETGLSTLRLDDLMVCLMNAFTEQGKFGCTIVPKPEALKAVRTFLGDTAAKATAATGRKWRESLRAAVGKQDIIVDGVSPDSGVAKTIVGADYLMKKIGMGLAPTIDQCPNYFQRVAANPAAGKDQSLIRWWFTMAHDRLVKDANDRIFQFSGNSIKVLSENELVNQLGQRVHTGASDGPTAGFAEDFSLHFDLLSKKHPIFASLKNIFDLALVANIVKKYDVKNRDRWERRFGGGPVGSTAQSRGRTRYVVDSHQHHTEVDSIMNFETFKFVDGGKRFRRTMVGVSGGVEFDFYRLSESLKITEQSASQFPSVFHRPPPNRILQERTLRWWWD